MGGILADAMFLLLRFRIPVPLSKWSDLDSFTEFDGVQSNFWKIDLWEQNKHQRICQIFYALSDWQEKCDDLNIKVCSAER